MARFVYENFDLLILPYGDHYQARVIGSPAGQGSVEFVLPFRMEELSTFPWLIEARGALFTPNLASTDAAATMPTALVPKAFGERLFRAVFAGDVGKLLLRSRDLVETADKALRIQLRIDPAAAALAALPWEYLYVPDWQRFPALSDQTPIVRYIELTQPVRPLQTTQPLRILAVVANPQDAPPLQVEQEWERLQNALSALQTCGMVILERLAQPTLPSLQNRLREVDIHILHFIGHGLFAPERAEGSLLFENEQRLAHRVTAEQLATLLHDEELHLVYLNACEGARSGAEDAFAGVAQMLVQQGVAAVLAMQFAVSDSAAIALAHEFYQAIADGYGVDAAISEARKALYGLTQEQAGQSLTEWGTPVLYLRAVDGQIFEMQHPQPPEQGITAPRGAWHARGLLFLTAGVLGSVALLGFGYYRLTPWPILQRTVALMGGILALVVGVLSLREERTFFRWLSQWVGTTRSAQIGTGSILLLSLLLWLTLGRAQLKREACGPLPCPPPGVRYFAISNWENLTPGASAFEGVWTQGTRRVLYEKLNQVHALQGVALDSPQVADDVNPYLHLWIRGDFQKIEAVQLAADVSEQGIQDQTVTVREVINERADGVEDQILTLQNRLAEAILQKLEITVSEAELAALRKAPTDNGEALILNSLAGTRIEQGRDLLTAAALLRQAMELDPEYGSPHNNLGRLLYAQDDFAGALAEQQQAVALAPNTPLFHFNLGLTLTQLGDDAGAARAYEQAVALDPGYAAAWTQLGATYLRLGETEKARDASAQGLQLAPTSPE